MAGGVAPSRPPAEPVVGTTDVGSLTAHITTPMRRPLLTFISRDFTRLEVEFEGEERRIARREPASPAKLLKRKKLMLPERVGFVCLPPTRLRRYGGRVAKATARSHRVGEPSTIARARSCERRWMKGKLVRLRGYAASSRQTSHVPERSQKKMASLKGWPRRSSPEGRAKSGGEGGIRTRQDLLDSVSAEIVSDR